jgi:hypothetical protein
MVRIPDSGKPFFVVLKILLGYLFIKINQFLENQNTSYEKTRTTFDETFLEALHGLISYTFM